MRSDAVVKQLARELNRPLDEVRSVYEVQYQRLDSQARIKTYVSILAARHARKILTQH